MTIKELYDYAVKHHCKNAEIYINYSCSDCWYDFDGKLEKHNIKPNSARKAVFLEISDHDWTEEE